LLSNFISKNRFSRDLQIYVKRSNKLHVVMWSFLNGLWPSSLWWCSQARLVKNCCINA